MDAPSSAPAAPPSSDTSTASSNRNKIQRSTLPVDACRSDILKLVADNQFVIITGDTGSGKSTQLAQFLHAAGYAQSGTIAITQPRRVGAVSVSRRVSQEMGVHLGDEVGYMIRFEDCTSAKTKIKFMTDGCLLREALTHKNLEPYSIVVLDEAHERSLQTDILFGLIREIAPRRPDIKFIVTSATLDARQFSSFFFNCPTYHVPGRCFPVEIVHGAHTESRYYVERAVEQALLIHANEPLGDVLVFLTGEEEINRACALLGKKVDSMLDDGLELPDIVILPVYAALQSQQQQAIFGKAPPNCRKVLFSTNICETSLTVDGIVYVIDSGFVKQKVFSAETGIESLLITPISQVQATQRAGRAGRTRPGKCYRLYTEKTFEHEMPKSTLPEIQRANLANTVLMLKEFGIVDVLAFPFLDPPSPGLLIEALQQLFWLDAIDLNGHLTDAGRRLASLPLEPALGSMLLLGGEYGCCAEMLTIAAMLSVENLLERPSERNEAELAEMRHKLFYSEHGDHVMLLAIYESWLAANGSHQWCSDNYFQARALDKAKSIRQQLEELLSKHVKSVASTARPDKVVKYCCKAIARCFFHHAARRTEQENKYKTLAPAGVDQCAAFIHPSSPLALTNPKWVTYAELTYTTRPYMRHVCAIDYEWIEKLVPKLQQADPRRLTGRSVLPKTLVAGVPEAIAAPVAVSDALVPQQQQSAGDLSVLGKRRIDDAAEAARQRYLERKRAAGK